jgi:D-threonate/D-erythronate kinase
MTMLRLLADDLTGALDTAAEFVPITGAVPIFWPTGNDLLLSASAGFDSGTREADCATAHIRVSGLVPLLDGADIAFKKVDSLMRGPTLVELAACMQAGIWRHCVLAPAFPFHRRITRNGRQHVGMNGDWVVVGGDLVAALRSLGLAAQPGCPDAALQPGITVFDAETDADLRRVVTAVRRCAAPVLWAGTGGLAQALSGGHRHPVAAPLPRPLLGLFGSDQPTTAEQLAACAPHWLRIEDADDAQHWSRIEDATTTRLTEAGVALISFAIPDGSHRTTAARRIAAGIERLVDRLDPPGTVVVSGGETLRSLCDALGTASLLVQDRIVPGVAHSVMTGGRWNGVTVVSKSGAFGHPALLRDLILERTAP